MAGVLAYTSLLRCTRCVPVASPLPGVGLCLRAELFDSHKLQGFNDLGAGACPACPNVANSRRIVFELLRILLPSRAFLDHQDVLIGARRNGNLLPHLINDARSFHPTEGPQPWAKLGVPNRGCACITVPARAPLRPWIHVGALTNLPASELFRIFAKLPHVAIIVLCIKRQLGFDQLAVTIVNII